MRPSWSHGRMWEIHTAPLPERRGGALLLTVHDAPKWIAEEMLKAAEKFVAPLVLSQPPDPWDEPVGKPSTEPEPLRYCGGDRCTGLWNLPCDDTEHRRRFAPRSKPEGT